MNIERFGVEEWMDKYESDAKYNITDTCARPMTLKELFALAGEDREDFVEALFEKEQSYGSIYGLASLKEEIAGLYETITPDDILTQHGATGGNQHVLFSLVRPGDRVVAFSPSYQQFCSTPRALGANVTVLKLRRSNGFLPDLDELRKAAARGLRLICINNPNNPTGSLIPEDMMKEIVEIARSSGTYILCDEVYAGVSIEGAACPSIADLYEKASRQAPCPKPSLWQDSASDGWQQRARKLSASSSASGTMTLSAADFSMRKRQPLRSAIRKNP